MNYFSPLFTWKPQHLLSLIFFQIRIWGRKKKQLFNNVRISSVLFGPWFAICCLLYEHRAFPPPIFPSGLWWPDVVSLFLFLSEYTNNWKRNLFSFSKTNWRWIYKQRWGINNRTRFPIYLVIYSGFSFVLSMLLGRCHLEQLLLWRNIPISFPSIYSSYNHLLIPKWRSGSGSSYRRHSNNSRDSLSAAKVGQ